MYTTSVVLATYQGEAYILEQLTSLYKQTMVVDEIVIVDDASSDATCRIIQDFINAHHLSWKWMKHTKNIGYIRSFVDGMKKASGDIIFLCDQDDIWEEHKVEELVSIFRDQPEIMCVNTSFTYMDAAGEDMGVPDQNNNYGMCRHPIGDQQIQNIDFNEIVCKNISMGCTMAFRACIKDIYCRQSTWVAPHDWEINRLAAATGGLYFYNRKLIWYRIHDANTTGNDKLTKPKEDRRMKNAQTLCAYAKSYHAYEGRFTSSQQALCQQFETFCEKRMSLLQSGRKRDWWYLLRHFKIYRQLVSKKGMLVDAFYHHKHPV